MLKTSDNAMEFDLPYGWRKLGHRRKSTNTSKQWDFYLISPDNNRFRSNVEDDCDTLGVSATV